MKANFSRGLLFAVFAALTACTDGTIDDDVKNGPDDLSEEDRQYIDEVNADQDADIADTQTRVDQLENSLAALYPVAAIDNKLSSSAASAIFGSELPAGEQGRKNTSEQYVSVEAALTYLANRTTSGGNGSSASGGTTVAGSVTYNNAGAGSPSVFETADSVEEAINALRWASNVLITTQNTNFGNIATVQGALENLDDRVAALGSSGGNSSGTPGTVTASSVQAGPNATDTFGVGEKPWNSTNDAYPELADATNVKQAINALRFINTSGSYFDQSGHPVVNGYVSEAVLALDRRAYDLESFLQNYENNGGQLYTVEQLLFDPSDVGNPTSSYTERNDGSGTTTLPLGGFNLTDAISEMAAIMEANSWADRVKVDFGSQALSDSRWAAGTDIRGGQFQTPADDPRLEDVLEQINNELDDLYTTVSNGVDPGDIYAADVIYNPLTANDTLTFGNSVNVDQALGALRYSKNVRYDPTTANSTLTFGGSQYVQDAIGALRYSNNVRYDPTTANSTLTFGTSQYVQDAIGALRYSSNVRYDPTTANSNLVFANAQYVQDAIGALRYATNVSFDPSVLINLGYVEFTNVNTVQAAIVTSYQFTMTALQTLPTTLLGDQVFIDNLTTVVTNTQIFIDAVNNLINQYLNDPNNNFTVDASKVTITTLNPNNFGGGDHVDEALSYLQTQNTARADEITDIRNVTNNTFRSALTTYLLGDTTFLTNLATNTTFETQLGANNQFVDALFANTYFTTKLSEFFNANGGGGGYILGRTATTTTGKMQNGGFAGIAAANKYCRDAFPNDATAHVCTVSEAQVSFGKGQVGNLASGQTGWVLSHTPVGITARNAQQDGATIYANCQDFLYQTAHVSDGTFATYNTAWPSPGDPNGLTGSTLHFTQNATCGAERAVLCCR